MKFVISVESGAEAAAQLIEDALRSHSVVANKFASDVSNVPASELLSGGAHQFSAGTKVHTFTSTSSALDLLWNISIKDSGMPNDGRKIVVSAASKLAAPTVVSDSGGTPAARLDDAQLSGTGASWSFTAGSQNDLDSSTMVISVEYKNELDVNDGAVVTASAMDDDKWNKFRTLGARIIRVCRADSFSQYAESVAAGELDFTAAIAAINDKQKVLSSQSSQGLFDVIKNVSYEDLRDDRAGVLTAIQTFIGLPVESITASTVLAAKPDYETKFTNWKISNLL